MTIHEILTELELNDFGNPESLLIKLEGELAIIPVKPVEADSIKNIERFAACLYYRQTIALTRYRAWLALWLAKQETVESHTCILLIRSLNHLLFLQYSYINFLEGNRKVSHDGLHYHKPVMIQDYQNKLTQLLRRKESAQVLATVTHLSELLNQKFQDASYKEHPIFWEFNLNTVVRQLVFLQKKEKTAGETETESETLTLNDITEAEKSLAVMASDVRKKLPKIATAGASVATGAALTATGAGAPVGISMMAAGAAAIVSEIDPTSVANGLKQSKKISKKFFNLVSRLFSSSPKGIQDKLAYVDALMKEIHYRSSEFLNELLSNFFERFPQDNADEEFLFKYCAIIQALTISQYCYILTHASTEWLTESLNRFVDFHDMLVENAKCKETLDWFYLFLSKSKAWTNIPSELRDKIRRNKGASCEEGNQPFYSTNAPTLLYNHPHPPEKKLSPSFSPSPRALRIKEKQESCCSGFR